MPELLRNVVGYNGLYKISKTGQVLSVRKNVYLKQEFSNETLVVRLLGHRKEIAQLLLEAYVPNEGRGKYVKHIDGNRENNTIENLKWSRTKEPAYPKYTPPRNRCKKKKLHIQGVKATYTQRKRIAVFEDKYHNSSNPSRRGKEYVFRDSILGINNVAKKYGVTRSAIYKCRIGKIKAVKKRYVFRVQHYDRHKATNWYYEPESC